MGFVMFLGMKTKKDSFYLKLRDSECDDFSGVAMWCGAQIFNLNFKQKRIYI